jgi:predicted O-methyltransferase YrrM
VSDLDPSTTENRRLRKENVDLRARVAAFESSRWWRLHPRLRLRDLRRRLTLTSKRTASGGARDQLERTHEVANSLRRRFHEEIASRGVFSADWFTDHIPRWEPTLAALDGRSSSILEIGSFEGLASCYLLWRLHEAKLTCVDTFEGSTEHLAYGDVQSDLEKRFTQNVALVDASRVRKIRGDSRRVLVDLAEAHEQFDLVYVDGSHHALDVLVDAALSWNVLAPGGVLIFDDYTWRTLGDDPLLRPGPAIDAFLDLVGDHCEVLLHDRQVALRRTDLA